MDSKMFLDTDAMQKRIEELTARLRAEWMDTLPYILISSSRPVSLEDGVLTLVFRRGAYYCPCCNEVRLSEMIKLGVRLIRARHPRHIKHSATYSMDYRIVEAKRPESCNAEYVKSRVEEDPKYGDRLFSGDLPQIPGVLEWELYDLSSEPSDAPAPSP